MSELLVPIVVVFILAVLLNVTIFSCICISIQRGKKLEVLGTMDNFFYMRAIRRLLQLSSIFLLIECIGFLVHYSFHNQTTNPSFNTILIAVNINIINMDSEPLYVSDCLIYVGFLLFLLCSVGAYYIALHRFLLTNQQSKSSYDTHTYLHIICIVCYIIILLTAITFSCINLFITYSSTLYYIFLICFDIQLFLSSIPVLKSLQQVIEISRDSAKSVRWSVTNVSPSKLFYKMSVKAVRMSMENIILNLLLLVDIAFNAYQIIQTQTNIGRINGAIPRHIHSAHLIILYFIQLFMILWLNDYTWINRKYITVRQTTPHRPAPKRHEHTRTNFSDFDYNNTVLHLKRTVTPACPLEVVQLKGGSELKSDLGALEPVDDMDELQFLKLSDKIKLRSVSLTPSTYHSKRKVHKEFLTKKASYDLSVESLKDRRDSKVGKRRRSVLSRIPDAAKRMSRSFVGAVIAVDSIWDEPDLGDGTHRWSRYNKQSKPSKSSRTARRHSLPNNAVSASPKRALRKQSLTLRANIPVFALNTPPNVPPIASPESVLDVAVLQNCASYPGTTKLENITEKRTPKVLKVPITDSRSLTLHIRNNTDNTVSSVASPKTYSQRNPSTLYSDPPGSLSDMTAKTDSNGNTIQTRRQKFFSYQCKLQLTDRMSELTESPSMTPQTATLTHMEVMELSQFSDLSEIACTKKQSGEIKSTAKQFTLNGKKTSTQIMTFMETSLEANGTLSNIETSELDEHEREEAIASSASPEPNIVIAINDQTVHKTDTKTIAKDDDQDECSDRDAKLMNSVPKMGSLDFDEDEMGDILQCIDEYQ
eukprot:7140_1